MAVLIVVIRHKYNSVNPIMYENRNPCRSTDCSDSFCVHYKVNRDFQKKKKNTRIQWFSYSYPPTPFRRLEFLVGICNEIAGLQRQK